MMDEEEKKNDKNTTITVLSISPTLTEDRSTPPPYRGTWDNDSVPSPGKKRNWGAVFWKPKSRWIWARGDGWNTPSKPTTKATDKGFKAGYTCSRDTIWAAFKKFRSSRGQCFALALLAVFGLLPMVLLGVFTSGGPGYSPYQQVFSDKIMGCGQSLGSPQNATASGIQKLFVLDVTFGRYSFAAVKTIDVIWDLFIGRGFQICASWAAYKAFCDALLLVIERQPASFRIFQRIALEGPSLDSLWTLTKELFTRNDTRTKFLFSYMFVATLYVLMVPIFLGAMTGYDSTNIPWINLDDSNNIVPASLIKPSWVALGTKNETFKHPACVDWSVVDKARQMDTARFGRCDCQLANGTMIAAQKYFQSYYKGDLGQCIYDFPGNMQTFTYDPYWSDSYDQTLESGSRQRNCNASMDIEINGQKYDYATLKSESGYCYGDVAYDYTYFEDRTRCLPDTANPSYKWGFATMMSGLFIFLTFGWCTSLYIVWQHAQCKSTLVQTGYTMTPLRAAFAMAKAAKKKTGLAEQQLIRAYTEDLENELYGRAGLVATSIEYGLFVEEPGVGDADQMYHGVRGVRARHVRGEVDVEAK